MRTRFLAAMPLFLALTCRLLSASAYDAQPKLVVVIIIDQLRGDYLHRAHEKLSPDGFRLFMERGAYFSDCNYDYANTRTAPGIATLLTGAYTDGHGIIGDEWWDPAKKVMITSIEDNNRRLLGPGMEEKVGASPHNLRADTIGDELRLATQGRGHVFSVSLNDRSAVLAGGFSANAAYWIDHLTGKWISSTYYMAALPKWVQQFNASGQADRYWNLEWKDSEGEILRNTNKPPETPDYYYTVGSTPFGNDYELDFVRALIAKEKVGKGPATDLLVISFSTNDVLGHQAGPDSPESKAMVLAVDRQLAGFFGYLEKQIGLDNVWIALASDHGVSPVPWYASRLRLPATNIDGGQLRAKLNEILSARFGQGEYVPNKGLIWPIVFLDEDAFAAAKLSETDAEQAGGEALKQIGMRSYFTRAQLATFRLPADELGRKYLHSYSSQPGWYVLGVPPPYYVGTRSGTDQGSPYSYDTHVPLAFFGRPFRPGVYRTHSEPIDLAPTLASLLGVNAPTSAAGRVLTEALHRPENSRKAFRVAGEREPNDVQRKQDKH